jgi:Tfp pilus assembly protein PilN
MIDINLIASRRAQRQRSVAMMRLAFYGLFGVAIVIALLFAWISLEIRAVQGQIAEVDGYLSAPDMRAKVERINFLESQTHQLAPRVDVLKKVHDSESNWIQLVRDVGASVPANVGVTALTSRKMDNTHQITITGIADSQSLIGAYMLALQRADWCGRLQLVQSDTKQSATNRNGVNGVNYELLVPLKTPIGLNLPGSEEKPPAPKASASEAGGGVS